MTPGARNKFQFEVYSLDLCGAVARENAETFSPVYFACHFRGKFDSAPHSYKINVGGMASEENVAHVSANHINFSVHAVGNLSDLSENGKLKIFFEVHS